MGKGAALLPLSNAPRLRHSTNKASIGPRGEQPKTKRDIKARRTTSRDLIGAIAGAFDLAGCVALEPLPDLRRVPAPEPAPGQAPVLPSLDQLPPADSVALRRLDGSPGLGLWCDLRGDCIEAARILCANQQSIRTASDLDMSDPRANMYLSRSANAPHSLVVSCPVQSGV